MEFDGNSQARLDPRPDLVAAFARFRRSPVPEIGLRAGDPVPPIVLKDVGGRPKALVDEIRRGSVVLVFDAGPWNPSPASFYDALLGIEPEIRRLGGALVVISPASPGKRRGATRCIGGGIVHLMDPDGQVAGLFGIVVPVPDDLRAIYMAEGYPMSSQDQDTWGLPLSATFVIDREGAIAYSSVGEPPLVVAEPTAVVTILKCLQSRSPNT